VIAMLRFTPRLRTRTSSLGRGCVWRRQSRSVEIELRGVIRRARCPLGNRIRARVFSLARFGSSISLVHWRQKVKGPPQPRHIRANTDPRADDRRDWSRRSRGGHSPRARCPSDTAQLLLPMIVRSGDRKPSLSTVPPSRARPQWRAAVRPRTTATEDGQGKWPRKMARDGTSDERLRSCAGRPRGFSPVPLAPRLSEHGPRANPPEEVRGMVRQRPDRK
jgi:hypothetical protein